MKPGQEIRARAIEIKMNQITTIMAACVSNGKGFDGSEIWTDGTLEEICEYIATGKKPVIP